MLTTGMRHDPSRAGALLVLDAYHGLLRVDTTRSSVELLFDSKKHGLALVNDLDISADGQLGEHEKKKRRNLE